MAAATVTSGGFGVIVRGSELSAAGVAGGFGPLGVGFQNGFVIPELGPGLWADDAVMVDVGIVLLIGKDCGLSFAAIL